MYITLAVFAISFAGILGYFALRHKELSREERFFESFRCMLDKVAWRLAIRIRRIPTYVYRVIDRLWKWTLAAAIQLLAQLIALLYTLWWRSKAFLWGRTRRLRTSKAASHFLSQVAEHKRRIMEEQKRE